MSTSVNSTSHTAINQPELVPCVRVGFSHESDQPRQAPILQPITDPLPEGAETVSPIYLLTQSQLDRQDRMKSHYAVSGPEKTIASKLQRQCERRSRVIYPIHLESDAKIPFAKMIDQMGTFVEIEIGCEVGHCTIYHTGHRSIHFHVPRVAIGESEREQLKKRVQAFCEETSAQFDLSIYNRGSQFRLPGIQHSKTGLRKVEIEPWWDHETIIKTAATSNSAPPKTYLEVIDRVFERGTGDSAGTLPSVADDEVSRVVEDMELETVVFQSLTHERQVPVPIEEQMNYPSDSDEQDLWLRYNAKAYSPYALAAGNPRSVAALRVMGGAFSRANEEGGAPLIPAYFYGAEGCDGEFTMFRQEAPLKLSGIDYRKWTDKAIEAGDNVVIIGGQSRSSRIFVVDTGTAAAVGAALNPEDGSRPKALDYLRNHEFEVGSEAKSSNRNSRKTKASRRRRDYETVPPVTKPPTSAAELQQRAEREGIRTLDHRERWCVANRLLKVYGWDLTWKWFKTRFGSGFDKRMTHKQLESVITSYPDDFCHVTVPPLPE